MKWDGHTHTEFCPHGSGDMAEAMVRRAIELGFTRYSITEHAPLPGQLSSLLPKGQKDVMQTSNILDRDVDAYIKEVLRLKEAYKDQIQIFAGFEVDYIEGTEAWYREFFKEYGPWLDDGVLSVHYIKKDGFLHPLDSDRDYVVQQLIPSAGGFGPYCKAYYQTVLDSIHADLGPYGPRRIGHMSLCRKYRLAEELAPMEPVPAAADTDASALGFDVICLEAIHTRGYALDFNTAGLSKPLCRQFYPGEALVRRAIQMHIPLVYGSDSHGVEDVGRNYQVFESARDMEDETHEKN